MSHFSHAVINGNLVPFDHATISLAHPVFLTSHGVYESIQVDEGRPFCLPSHLRRLIASARWLAIDLPAPETLLEWAQRLIQALPNQTYALLILAIAPTTTEPLLVAFLPKPLRRYAPGLYEHGAAAITFAGERALPQCKSLNTLVNHLARAEAQRQNALEAILVSNGMMLEGARSNIFVVDAAGQLLTPPAEKTLSGITKEVVLAEMAKTDHPPLSRDIPVDTPLREMFITSTSMHVMPVTRLNGKPVGDGRVGTITKIAAARFEAFYRTAIRKTLA